MIGLHDHVYRQGSGRPEPHQSWAAERFTTWTGWFMAAVSFVGAAYYYLKWREADGVLPMVLGGVLFATIAYLRQPTLYRGFTPTG
jgi:hypothetical protein